MFQRIRPLVIMAMITTLSVSQAADSITDPTEDPTELWHYGTGMVNQTVTFSFDAPPLSSATVSIEVADNPGEELFSKNFIAPLVSPKTVNITVPDPNDFLTGCVVKVKLHPMSSDPVRTISRNVNIAKP